MNDYYVCYEGISDSISKIIIDREKNVVSVDKEFYYTENITQFENDLCKVLIDAELEKKEQISPDLFISNSIKNKTLFFVELP